MKTFIATRRNSPAVSRAPMPTHGPSPGAHRAEVRQILHGPRLQPKLTVGAPDDKFEREADQVADQVMRMPVSQVQRQCTECEKKKKLRRQPLAETGVIQAKERAGGVPAVSDEVARGIHSLRGGGQPLPESARSFFEPRFGADFSGVRVHTDASAGELAQRVEARAFTVGSNIVFGRGEFAPNAGEGKKLLAHELTHTIQQAQS